MSRMFLQPLLLAAGFSAIGCADSMSLSGNWSDTGFDLASGDENRLAQLRIDVYPSSNNPVLEPQSIEPGDESDWSNLLVELAPSVTFSGLIEGFTPNPYADVPGESSAPVQADVAVVIADTISGASMTTDDDGIFQLTVPAGSEYALSVVPSTPVDLPFDVATIDLSENVDEVLTLETGMPVYGQVLQSNGTTVPGDPLVYLVHDQAGVNSLPTSLNDNGHFMVRALPGAYTLVVEGDITSYVPRIETAVLLEDGDGLRVDMDMGYIEPAYVSGVLYDANGETLDGALVRFSSVELVDTSGESKVETTTDKYGKFDTQLLYGDWRAELIPTFDPDGNSTPTAFDFIVDQPNIDLDDIALPDRITFTSMVVNDDGVAIPYVVVTATELSYDNYSYSATTDQDGQLRMTLPDVPLEFTLTPPSSDSAITRFSVNSPDGVTGELPLVWGTAVEGTVHTEGLAVGYALVEIRDTDDNLYGTTLTDAEGRFSVRVDFP